jgi:hypothetical protein
MFLNMARLANRKADHDRIAIMVDSPYHHAYDQVRFTISERGVENAAADEDKKKVAESSDSGW